MIRSKSFSFLLMLLVSYLRTHLLKPGHGISQLWLLLSFWWHQLLYLGLTTFCDCLCFSVWIWCEVAHSQPLISSPYCCSTFVCKHCSHPIIFISLSKISYSIDLYDHHSLPPQSWLLTVLSCSFKNWKVDSSTFSSFDFSKSLKFSIFQLNLWIR